MLIVAERDLVGELGQTLLWSAEVERIVASSPAAACEIAPALAPDLVVIEAADQGAARAVLTRLRETPGARRSSIAVVATPDATSEAELRGAGANLVLRPPVDPDECDRALRRLLAVPRRVRARFPVRLGRRLAPGAPAVSGVALDVSLAGMLVEASADLRPGEALSLSFRLPGSELDLSATGEVVRRSTGTGAEWIGIRFPSLGQTARDAIERLSAAAAPDLYFGRYEVVGLLGEGAMGCVYRAIDPLAGRAVAIKTLRPELLAAGDRDDYLRRFRREAQAAAQLVHPNIVTIFDVGHDYFVMELLDGQTLQSLLRERGRLDPAEALALLRPVAEALDHAHRLGAIHRDVKPANIMVLMDGRTKVMDFGIAHLSSAGRSASGQVFGSPGYMAPEQLESRAVPASDLFALAVVAYETLSGRNPFDGGSISSTLFKVVSERPPPVTAIDPQLPSSYDQVFFRALAKQPEARFASASAFLDALGQARAPEHVAPAPPPAAPAAQQPEWASKRTLRLRSPWSQVGEIARRLWARVSGS
ncbi:MAG: protein kinase [Vicinamibacteria bacterium]